jgi:hypothetical protein
MFYVNLLRIGKITPQPGNSFVQVWHTQLFYLKREKDYAFFWYATAIIAHWLFAIHWFDLL